MTGVPCLQRCRTNPPREAVGDVRGRIRGGAVLRFRSRGRREDDCWLREDPRRRSWQEAPSGHGFRSPIGERCRARTAVRVAEYFCDPESGCVRGAAIVFFVFALRLVFSGADIAHITLVGVRCAVRWCSYMAYREANAEYMTSHGIDHAASLETIRLFSLCSLAAESEDGSIPYSTIARTLQVRACHTSCDGFVRWCLVLCAGDDSIIPRFEVRFASGCVTVFMYLMHTTP